MWSCAVVAVMLAVTAGVAFKAGRWWESVERDCVLDDPWPTYLPFPPPKMRGVYAPNAALHNISRIGEGKVPEPEDVAFDKKSGLFYAACADGWIRRFGLSDGGAEAVQTWRYVGGRPLGMAVGVRDEILVCEPFQGLLNVTEDRVRLLSDEAEGVKIKFADAVAVASDGEIYFTDASSKYGFGQSDEDFMEGKPHGRLLKYSPSTNTTTVLLSNLYFANGVALSSDQSFIIYCETAKARCRKYWLRGQKKGQTETFIDNLPGYPDNIHLGDDGLFWIGLVSKRSAMPEIMLRSVHFKKVVGANKMMLGKIGRAAYEVGRVVGVTESDGKVVKMLEDPDGSAFPFVTTALRVADSLYLGGFGAHFVGRLVLDS